MNLYHYRSIENAILELENGTFHFSTREELNDPLEGYLKIYWQGDKIAWEGLLKNYICSIDNVISLFLLQADSDMLRQNTLVWDIHHNDHVPLGKIWCQLTKKFISDEEIKKAISFYGNNNLKVYKDELAFLLRYFHTKALILCIESHMEHGLIDKSDGQKLLDIFKHKTTDIPENLFEKNIPSDEERKYLIKIMKNYVQDLLEYFYLSNPDMPKLNSEDATQTSIDNDSKKDCLELALSFQNTLTFPVKSVNLKTGNVTLTAADIGAVTEAFVKNEIANAKLDNSGSGVDLSGYATKDDLNNLATKNEVNAIDFPVDSVNGKTGAVTLSASDVGAATSNHTHNYAGSSSAGGAATSANKVNKNLNNTQIEMENEMLEKAIVKLF